MGKKCMHIPFLWPFKKILAYKKDAENDRKFWSLFLTGKNVGRKKVTWSKKRGMKHTVCFIFYSFFLFCFFFTFCLFLSIFGKWTLFYNIALKSICLFLSKFWKWTVQNKAYGVYGFIWSDQFYLIIILLFFCFFFVDKNTRGCI